MSPKSSRTFSQWLQKGLDLAITYSSIPRVGWKGASEGFWFSGGTKGGLVVTHRVARGGGGCRKLTIN